MEFCGKPSLVFFSKVEKVELSYVCVCVSEKSYFNGEGCNKFILENCKLAESASTQTDKQKKKPHFLTLFWYKGLQSVSIVHLLRFKSF